MNRIILVVVVALLSMVEARAQSGIADSLYWVVETNIHNPSYTIVRFYNYRNLMVHEVRLQGVYIDIRNPKHRRKLDLQMKQYHERSVLSSKKKKIKNTI